jgi:hypothetical protein
MHAAAKLRRQSGAVRPRCGRRPGWKQWSGGSAGQERVTVREGILHPGGGGWSGGSSGAARAARPAAQCRPAASQRDIAVMI